MNDKQKHIIELTVGIGALLGCFFAGNWAGQVILPIVIIARSYIPKPKKQEVIADRLVELIAEQDKKIADLKERFELVRISRGK
jgi:hypothetical protein